MGSNLFDARGIQVQVRDLKDEGKTLRRDVRNQRSVSGCVRRRCFLVCDCRRPKVDETQTVPVPVPVPGLAGDYSKER